MRVVELNGDLVGKCAPISVAVPETPHDIGQRTGGQKILLHEPQALAPARRIVGIQYPGQSFGGQRFGHRANEITVAERLEIKVIRRTGGPQSEGVDRLAAVADDRADRRGCLSVATPADIAAQAAVAKLECAIQLHFHLFWDA